MGQASLTWPCGIPSDAVRGAPVWSCHHSELKRKQWDMEVLLCDRSSRMWGPGGGGLSLQRDSGRDTAPSRNLIHEARCCHCGTWAGAGHGMLRGISSHPSAGRDQPPSVTGMWARKVGGLVGMRELRVLGWDERFFARLPLSVNLG